MSSNSHDIYSSSYVKHEYLRHFSVRKSTFTDWPQNSCDFRELVGAGFYHTQTSDEVICFSCGLKISGLTKDSHPYFIHRTLSPGCKFLNGHDMSIDRLPINGRISVVSLPSVTQSQFCLVDKNCIMSVDKFTLSKPPLKSIIGQHRNHNVEVPEISGNYKAPLIIPKNEDQRYVLCIDSFFKMMKNEKNRIETFKVNNWPHHQPTVEQMAKSGFFYCLLNDTVQCAYCRSCIAGWYPESSPFEVHKLFFPFCSFVKNEFQPLAICGPDNKTDDMGKNGIKTMNDLKERISCKICFEREVAVRFNCKHIVTCNDCSVKVDICPICRISITERIDVILC
jgi:E3 ubiquitin-protein ligase XIAP